MALKPARFIAEEIDVIFATPPLYEKKPGCPDAFVWQEESYEIVELLSAWQDYHRRGKMAHNMRPSHAAAATRRGSWGVGRSYFRVRTGSGQIFELYYDRAPRGIDDRSGAWYLYKELAEG